MSADETAGGVSPQGDSDMAASPVAATSPPIAGSDEPVEQIPQRRPFWTRIDRPFVFGFMGAIGALSAFVLGMAVSNLSTVLIYIALALFLALGIDPVVRLLERRGMSRAWAIVLVFVGLLILLAIILWAILPTVIEQISLFVQSVPGTIRDFLNSDLYARLQDQFGESVTDLVSEIQKFLTDPGNIATIGGGALKVGASVATAISGVVIVIVLTLYFVATLPTIKSSMLRLIPARDRQSAGTLTDQITDSVGGYVMGMAILAFCNAVLVFLLYLFLGLPFPMLLATMAFLITLIPLVGSLLMWIIGSTLALFTSPVSALIFAIVYLIYMQIEAYIMTPRVMNKTISIPGSLVVIGALIGGTLLGLLGALVAVPVTASILLIIKQVLIPRQDAKK